MADPFGAREVGKLRRAVERNIEMLTGPVVYLVSFRGTRLLKIGTSRHLRRRLQQLARRARPVPTVLVASRPGGLALERRVMQAAAAFRVQHEVFRDDADGEVRRVFADTP